MTRVILVVEGQTEETFVNKVLTPALSMEGIYVTATRIMTSQTATQKFKGGLVNFAHLERDVSKLLASDQRRYVGCMVDLYKLPNTAPGYEAAAEQNDAYAKARTLQNSWTAHFANPRFIPYVQLHEFEALLYANPDAALAVTGHTALATKMHEALAQVGGNPELVNQTPAGAPSKRLLAAFSGYEKVVHGVQIAQEVGLHVMREKCTHFAAWYAQLASLSAL